MFLDEAENCKRFTWHVIWNRSYYKEHKHKCFAFKSNHALSMWKQHSKERNDWNIEILCSRSTALQNKWKSILFFLLPLNCFLQFNFFALSCSLVSCNASNDSIKLMNSFIFWFISRKWVRRIWFCALPLKRFNRFV